MSHMMQHGLGDCPDECYPERPRPDASDAYSAAFAVGFLIGAFIAALVTRALFL